MRGSDVDAALYWLAKMIHAGEDPRFITRRILICAAEDVGLADPMALVLAVAAHQAAEFVGWPEARIPIAEATIYIATAHKSNSAYVAIDAALEDVRSGRTCRAATACGTPITRAPSDWGTGRITSTRTIFPIILCRRIIWARRGDITKRPSKARKRKSRNGWKNGARKSRPCANEPRNPLTDKAEWRRRFGPALKTSRRRNGRRTRPARAISCAANGCGSAAGAILFYAPWPGKWTFDAVCWTKRCKPAKRWRCPRFVGEREHIRPLKSLTLRAIARRENSALPNRARIASPFR
jgi:hypothetical protein